MEQTNKLIGWLLFQNSKMEVLGTDRTETVDMAGGSGGSSREEGEAQHHAAPTSSEPESVNTAINDAVQEPTPGASNALVQISVRLGDNSVKVSGVTEEPIEYLEAASSTNFVSVLATYVDAHPNLLQRANDNVFLHQFVEMDGDPHHPYRANVDSQTYQWCARALTQAHIRFSTPRVLALADRTSIQSYLRGDSVDSRSVSTKLSTLGRIPGDFGLKIAHLLDIAIDVVDNTTWYAVGWILWAKTRQMELAGVDPVGEPWAQGNYIRRRLDPLVGQRDTVHDAMMTDLQDGCMVFLQSSLGADETMLIGWIANGAQSIHAPPGRSLLLDCWQTNPIPSRLYGLGAAPLPGANLLSSAAIRGALMSLAAKRHEEDMCLGGFARVAEMMAGRYTRSQEDEQPQAIHITATLQMLDLKWPCPRDSSWMWRLLGTLPSRPVHSGVRDEWQAFNTLSANVLEAVGFVLGAALGCANSTILHDSNMTGSEVQGWAGKSVGFENSSAVLSDIYLSEDEKEPAPLWRLICGTLQKLTKLVIDPYIWAGCEWSGGGGAFVENQLQPELFWHYLWPHSVPYPIWPLSLFDLWDAYAVHWCIYSKPIRYNFHLEVEVARNAANCVWNIGRGDSLYNERASSDEPYRYIGYGAIAVNAIRQDHVIPLLPGIEWKSRPHVRAGTGEVTGVNANIPAPTDFPALLTHQPGTFLSFWWDSMEVISPCIRANALPVNVWTALTSPQEVEAMRGGFAKRKPMAAAVINPKVSGRYKRSGSTIAGEPAGKLVPKELFKALGPVVPSGIVGVGPSNRPS